MFTKTFLTTAALAVLAVAKTDLEGCTSSETVVFGGASMIYWVPDTGEICSFLDCGGGRAPPKTTVPGCGNYVGTATYTPDYMPGWGPNGASATPTQTALNSVANPTETGFSQAPGGDVTSEGQTLTGLPTMTQLVTGTGAPAGSANGTATFSTGAPSQPSGTGNAAAAVMGFAGQGVVGLAGLVAGLVVL